MNLSKYYGIEVNLFLYVYKWIMKYETNLIQLYLREYHKYTNESILYKIPFLTISVSFNIELKKLYIHIFLLNVIKRKIIKTKI